MGPEALAQVLRPLHALFPAARFPDLLVGLEVSDDAAVYRVSDDVAVIHTLDFFTPVVDDPYDYGAIAAANALSDVYAMGGEAVMALNICGFPPKMPLEITAEILRGGAEKVAEAGAALAGGHTIDDNEPKYGLSVMGIVHPQHILKKGGALPGDLLVLTKPLGVGLITTAAKGDVAAPEHVQEAVVSMKRLNRDAARVMQQVEAHAVTDITGFGLLGHGYEMAEKGGVRLRFFTNRLPFVAGARDYAEQWLFPGGSCRNQRFYEEHISFGDGVPEEMRMLLFTPETSGGLLAAISPLALPKLSELCAARQVSYWVIGEVLPEGGIEVVGS